MKIIILPTLLLTVLTTSSAHYYHYATEDRRVHGPCYLGFRDGRRMVKNEWDRTLGRNCDYIWDLEDDAQRAADRSYRRARNWREREFNRCARLGVQDEVKKYEKKCLDDTSDQCFELAQAAAEAIVLEFVCLPPDTAKVPNAPIDYNKNCRTLGKNNCPGRIWMTVAKWCPEEDDNMTTKNRLDLEKKCGSKVDSFFET